VRRNRVGAPLQIGPLNAQELYVGDLFRGMLARVRATRLPNAEWFPYEGIFQELLYIPETG